MQLSVIIPTLNEAPIIADTLERVRRVADCEIIVVDGGSSDGTRDAAQAADLVLLTPPGRARQQNAGASEANGDILFFLHADCWPEPGVWQEMQSALSDQRLIGGCFRQSIDADRLGYRLLEWGNTLRVRTAGWIYGDQGLFVRREVFDAIGGFPEIDLMEDLYLAKQLKRAGRLKLLDHRLHVSPRRWQQQGVVRQTLRNWTFLGLSHLGVSPTTLARNYADVR